MKRHLKKIAVVLLAIMVFTSMAGYVYAANTTFRDFSQYIYIGSYSSITASPQLKTDASPLYIRLDENAPANSYFVRALACGRSTLNAVNCTIYNKELVDHVIIDSGKHYSIDSVTYENGPGCAVLSLMTYGSPGTVTGQWAPDTAQQFNSPYV